MTEPPPPPPRYPPAGLPAAPSPGHPGHLQAAYRRGYTPPYPRPRGTNTMAILALVLGLLFPPVGIVLGHIARSQIRQTGEEGDTLALVGLVLSYVFTGIAVAMCLGYAVVTVLFIGLLGVSVAA